VRVVGRLRDVDLQGGVLVEFGMVGSKRGLTSTSFILVISPVEDWPVGVGRLDVQWSLKVGFVGAGTGAAAAAGDSSLGEGVLVSCASLSGALVASSVSVMVELVWKREELRWG
jgi:hypothetical protein